MQGHDRHDAREHGVVVRPVDVTVSDWRTLIEEPMQAEGSPRCAGLDAHDLRCLSGADALATLAVHHPEAVWEATGADTRPTEMLRQARTMEDPVTFDAPEDGADVADDYAAMGLTLRRHLLALIRNKLRRYRIWTAEDLRHRAKNGQTVRASGIVTHRQQPSTASGVIFATMDDEIGTVNIIVWPSVAEEQRRTLRSAKLLSVQGTWQSEKGVQSLVAQKLRDHTELLERLRVASRDFRFKPDEPLIKAIKVRVRT